MVDVLVVVARIATYASILVLTGALLFIALAWPSGGQSVRMQQLINRSLLATIVASVAAFLLFAPASEGKGLSAIFDLSMLNAAIQTRMGVALALRLVLLIVLRAAVRKLFARSESEPASYLGVVVLLTVLMATVSFTGHAYNRGSLVLAMDIAHLMAAAMWFGGLIVLTTIVLPHSKSSELATAVPNFSTLAFGSVVLLAVTGAYHGFIEVGSVGAITTTGYGRLLCVKVVAFVVILGFGALSRRHTQRRFAKSPTVAEPGGNDQLFRRRLWQSVAGEVVVAMLVLAVTAVLVASSPPSHHVMALALS